MGGGTVFRDGTFAGTGRFPRRDVCRDGTFSGTGRFPGRDVFRDGTFAGTGRFLGRDVFQDLAMHVYISYLSQTVELVDMVDNHIIKKSVPTCLRCFID